MQFNLWLVSVLPPSFSPLKLSQCFSLTAWQCVFRTEWHKRNPHDNSFHRGGLSECERVCLGHTQFFIFFIFWVCVCVCDSIDRKISWESLWLHCGAYGRHTNTPRLVRQRCLCDKTRSERWGRNLWNPWQSCTLFPSSCCVICIGIAVTRDVPGHSFWDDWQLRFQSRTKEGNLEHPVGTVMFFCSRFTPDRCQNIKINSPAELAAKILLHHGRKVSLNSTWILQRSWCYLLS